MRFSKSPGKRLKTFPLAELRGKKKEEPWIVNAKLMKLHFYFKLVTACTAATLISRVTKMIVYRDH